jgi:hypothetical protein
MRSLILTQKNIISGTNNTVLDYSFPGGGVDIKPGAKIALSSITMYNSSPNISAVYKNNTFSYKWVDGVTYNVVISDGFFEISNLNDYLHQQFIVNKHYLVEKSTGKFVWFLTMAVNASTYKVDVVTYPMNSTRYPSTTYTNPGTWTVPVTDTNPQLIVQANAFRDILGFSAGTFPAAANLPTTTTSSTSVPQVSPLSSYLLKCSLVNNSYSIPNNLLYSFSPSGVYGSQSVVAPYEMALIDCQPGFYTNVTVSLSDQNDRECIVLDPNIVILLVIDEK